MDTPSVYRWIYSNLPHNSISKIGKYKYCYRTFRPSTTRGSFCHRRRGDYHRYKIALYSLLRFASALRNSLTKVAREIYTSRATFVILHHLLCKSCSELAWEWSRQFTSSCTIRARVATLGRSSTRTRSSVTGSMTLRTAS